MCEDDHAKADAKVHAWYMERIKASVRGWTSWTNNSKFDPPPWMRSEKIPLPDKNHTLPEMRAIERALVDLKKKYPQCRVTAQMVIKAVDLYHHEHTICIGYAVAYDMATAIHSIL